MAEVDIDTIVVGERVRKELGNLLGLTESIRAIGFIHPIVVNTKYELVAGRRRLETARRLGLKKVPVRVVDSFDDALKALLAERDENTCREHLRPTEIAG